MDARVCGRDGMEDLRRPGWGARREALSSMQHVSLRRTRLAGSGCSPGPAPKGLRVGLEGSTPGAGGRKGRGERAPLHHCAGAAPPASHFLHGYLGPNPEWW